jgi:hypothetical protein
MTVQVHSKHLVCLLVWLPLFRHNHIRALRPMRTVELDALRVPQTRRERAGQCDTKGAHFSALFR